MADQRVGEFQLQHYSQQPSTSLQGDTSNVRAMNAFAAAVSGFAILISPSKEPGSGSPSELMQAPISHLEMKTNTHFTNQSVGRSKRGKGRNKHNNTRYYGDIYGGTTAEILQSVFNQTQHLDAEQRQALSHQTGLTGPQISRWFSKRREKLRKKQPTDTLSGNQGGPFPKEVRETLEAKFQASPNIAKEERCQLALQTNLSEWQIERWFQKRRVQARRDSRNGKGPVVGEFALPTSSQPIQNSGDFNWIQGATKQINHATMLPTGYQINRVVPDSYHMPLTMSRNRPLIEDPSKSLSMVCVDFSQNSFRGADPKVVRTPSQCSARQ